MALRGSCTICTDYFGCEQDISVTFCGHLFHGHCLSQWLKQCGTHRTCPQCRTKLTAKQVVSKLYINVPETEEDELDPFQLKNKLDEVESKLQKCKLDKKQMKESLREQESNKEKLKSAMTKLKKDLKQETNTSEFLQNELKVAKRMEKEAMNSQNDIKRLKERLRTYEKLESILGGQKSQVDEMLQQYTSGSNTSPGVQQLATFCVALKQEYETLKSSRNAARDELMKVKKELHQTSQELMRKNTRCEDFDELISSMQKTEDQLNEENRGLRRKIEALQSAISSPSDTRSSAISRLLAESPAPLMLTPGPDGIQYKKINKRFSSDGLAGKQSPVDMKKPKLSPSLDPDDVITLDAGEGTSFDGSFIAPPRKADKKLKMLKGEVAADSPGTVEAKKVCEEMGIKYIKINSGTKSSSMKGDALSENLFRRPLGVNNSAVPVGRHGPGRSFFGQKRVNKVQMSSKAKPFSAKPVLASALRPKLNLIKKKTGSWS